MQGEQGEKMTQAAETVIVGGGIWGLSTAYHLAQGEQKDICVLERNERPFSETTSQAAGLVGQIRSTPLMRQHSICNRPIFQVRT